MAHLTTPSLSAQQQQQQNLVQLLSNYLRTQGLQPANTFHLKEHHRHPSLNLRQQAALGHYLLGQQLLARVQQGRTGQPSHQGQEAAPGFQTKQSSLLNSSTSAETKETQVSSPGVAPSTGRKRSAAEWESAKQLPQKKLKGLNQVPKQPSTPPPAAQRRGRVASHLPNSSVASQTYSDVLGRVVDIPASFFGVDVPELYYRGVVKTKDTNPLHKDCVVVKFQEDGTQYWLPVVDVRRWLDDMRRTGRNEHTRTTGMASDIFAARILMQLACSGRLYAADREICCQDGCKREGNMGGTVVNPKAAPASGGETRESDEDSGFAIGGVCCGDYEGEIASMQRR